MCFAGLMPEPAREVVDVGLNVGFKLKRMSAVGVFEERFITRCHAGEITFGARVVDNPVATGEHQ